MLKRVIFNVSKVCFVLLSSRAPPRGPGRSRLWRNCTCSVRRDAALASGFRLSPCPNVELAPPPLAPETDQSCRTRWVSAIPPGCVGIAHCPPLDFPYGERSGPMCQTQGRLTPGPAEERNVGAGGANGVTPPWPGSGSTHQNMGGEENAGKFQRSEGERGVKGQFLKQDDSNQGAERGCSGQTLKINLDIMEGNASGTIKESVRSDLEIMKRPTNTHVTMKPDPGTVKLYETILLEEGERVWWLGNCTVSDCT